MAIRAIKADEISPCLHLCKQNHKRNNWTFFGSDNGGRTAAVPRRFVTSCELAKIDPFAWFRDDSPGWDRRFNHWQIPRRMDRAYEGNSLERPALLVFGGMLSSIY